MVILFSQESMDSFYQSPPANGVLHVNGYPGSIWVSFNPLTPKISSVILLTVSQMILTMLVWRIWLLDQLVIP